MSQQKEFKYKYLAIFIAILKIYGCVKFSKNLMMKTKENMYESVPSYLKLIINKFV